MTANLVTAPFMVFSDIDGSVLDGGYIWIGEENLDPVANPVSAFWDSALTIPASQPIRTINGYPARNGSAANIFIAETAYSILIKNANLSFVFSMASASIAGVVTTSNIVDNSVTLVKLQQIATNTILGRETTGTGDVELIDCTAAGRALIDDASASDQRTTLGLGTMSTQAASSVAITGGTVAGITDLAVADGGTGASSAAGARTNLGITSASGRLVIGGIVMAWGTYVGDSSGVTQAVAFNGVGTGVEFDSTYSLQVTRQTRAATTFAITDVPELTKTTTSFTLDFNGVNPGSDWSWDWLVIGVGSPT